MKINKDLNKVMRSGKATLDREMIEKENTAGVIVAASILTAALLIMILIFIRLACR